MHLMEITFEGFEEPVSWWKGCWREDAHEEDAARCSLDAELDEELLNVELNAAQKRPIAIEDLY